MTAWQVGHLGVGGVGNVFQGVFIKFPGLGFAAVDAQAARLQARRGRIPGHVVDSLLLYSVLSMVMLGYILAVKGRRQYIASSLVLVLIADLDRPLGGAIVVSHQPLIDLQASMK